MAITFLGIVIEWIFPTVGKLPAIAFGAVALIYLAIANWGLFRPKTHPVISVTCARLPQQSDTHLSRKEVLIFYAAEPVTQLVLKRPGEQTGALVIDPAEVRVLRPGMPVERSVSLQKFRGRAAWCPLVDFLESQPGREMKTAIEFLDSTGKRRRQSFVVRAIGAQHAIEWIPGSITTTLFR
jgi:hypothetical protein